jgi:hypothetical protein
VPLWCIGLLASATALAAVAYLIGRERPAKPATALQAMLVAASSPGLALALVFGALVVGAASFRQLALRWLAWRPGSIQVAEFTAGSSLTYANAEELTMHFRRQLATLQLQSPTPVPGAAPASDFLDVLDRGGADSRNLLGTLVMLLRAAKPTHAYEVRGVLLEREARPRYGVAIEVVRVPSEGLTATTVWEERWDCALRRAAAEATAAILPQTRACRAPWGVWRGYVMPGRLMHAYEEGARLEHERRYDEALDRYYAALKDDPLNMVLRLRVGQLQERLGLFLDALATYWGICATSKPAGVRRPRLMYRGTGRRERRRAILSARYRRDVLLGGRVLTEQWLRSPEEPETERDAQRKRLRYCLRAQLKEALKHYATPKELETLLGEPESDDEGRFLHLRAVFARYALDSSRRLRWRLRMTVVDRRSTLTPATVRLTEVCIQSRLDFVRTARGEEVGWPPTAAQLDDRIRRIERGWLPVPGLARSFRRWHEHYNAACAYALPLVVPLPDGHASGLAQRAVQRLERATARADSAFIASRRDWLVSEDPDLVGLRVRKEFAEFEVMHLPSSSITPRRPANVQQLESSRYVRDLLIVAARHWQAIWRARRATVNGGLEVNPVLGWFGDELQSWEAIRIVAREYRHSGSRLRVIRNLQDGANGNGRPASAVGFPRYELDPLDGALAREPVDDAAGAEIEIANARLRALREIVGETPHDDPALMLADLKRWRSTLRRIDAAARPTSPYLLGLLCDHHAALWQLLGQWVEADAASAARAERDFREQVKRTRSLWRVAFRWWSAVSDTVDESRNGNGSAKLQPLDLVRAGAVSAWWHARIAQGDRRHARARVLPAR